MFLILWVFLYFLIYIILFIQYGYSSFLYFFSFLINIHLIK